jgi:hypothetical protein
VLPEELAALVEHALLNEAFDIDILSLAIDGRQPAPDRQLCKARAMRGEEGTFQQ